MIVEWRRLKSALLIGCLCVPVLLKGAPAEDLSIPDGFFKELKFRHIGPVGNRVSAVVGVPGDSNTYYIGAASGGIFKSSDGGVHWKPIFDEQAAASVGSLAIAPSDPNVIWAGTGETFIRSNVSIGNGIYKSTDGGKTWMHMGLEKTGRIGRIVIDPRNPDIVLAAAMGHCYGPQPERGVFRTSDGGKSWDRVLFVDENTGASDIVMDPNNPRILFAGMWQMVIWTWGRESGGPGSGLYTSRDGGINWQKLTGSGLPEPPWGKIGLSMSAADSDRIYALIETNSYDALEPLTEHQGVLWRSDDGGDNWKLISSDHTLVQRPHYYSRAAVSPDNASEIHFMATQHSISLDGGASIQRGDAGGDNHDMWIDPKNPARMIVGHDGGVSISTNRGKAWMRPRLPIAQMYHVFTDSQIPYFVYGNRQDGASARGPSNSLTGDDIPIGEWYSVGGCESGFAIPDPVDNNIVWSGCYEGILDRHDVRTGHSQSVSVWPDNPEGWPAAELKYRFQWTFPVMISPHDHTRIYAGSQHVHRSVDGGRSWEVVSPDLTTNDRSKQQKTGGLTPDDASPTYAAVLFALAESPLEAGVIWAGSNDGQVHLTRDGGETWSNLTPNIPELPPWGTISNIEPSRFKPGVVYLSVDLHQVNNSDPYVYKSVDYGQTWQRISSDIPQSVFSYVHCIREDPVRPGMLYLGTENGLYVSWNDGGNWHSLQSNLPHAPVHWLTVQEHFNDLVVATYGRGFWILDDLTPLQQLNKAGLESDVFLFAPRPAYRFREREAPRSQPEDPGAGENPAYGATIHYYLKSPAEQVKLTILDQSGQLIRTLEVKSESEDEEEDSPSSQSGLKRVIWDLRYEKSREPELRTAPLQHSHVLIGKKGWRSLVDGDRVAPLASPGNYTVKLEVGGVEFTQPLTVLKDPHSEASSEDIKEQVGMLLEIQADLNRVVDTINEIEMTRRQLQDLHGLLGKDKMPEETFQALQGVEKELIDVENQFFDLRLTNARQDTLRWPRRLYAKLSSLAGYIGSSDFPATRQQREVYSLYKEQLAKSRERFEEIRKGSIAELNRKLREMSDFPIVTLER